jgi:hypothetical protein
MTKAYSQTPLGRYGIVTPGAGAGYTSHGGDNL